MANLWFFPVWYYLLETPFNFKYFYQYAFVSVNPYLAAVLNVLFLAFIFLVGIRLLRRLNNSLIFKSIHFIFIGFFIIMVLLVIRIILENAEIRPLFFIIANKLGIEITLGLVGFFMLFAIILWRNQFISVISNFLIIMLPFVLVTFFQATVHGFSYNVEKIISTHTPIAQKLPANQLPSSRVVWIIFDEMSWRVAFGERLSVIQLPELDLFKDEAIYANNAYPPAGETRRSMPAYITGKLISEAKAVNGDLMINFGESKNAVKWSEQPNVFSKAREMGFNTAMIGYYHPYGRILKNSLVTYYGTPIFGAMGILETMYDQYRESVFKIPVLNSIVARQRHLDIYVNELEAAKKNVINPELGFTMIHFSIAHHPPIYNRREGKYTTMPNTSYLDNLALVDKTLGELHITMENAGVWDTTTIIITSDHYWRDTSWFQVPNRPKEDFMAFNGKRDGRIPFMIKLAGQKNHVTYEKEFNTVITHDLVLALLRQKVSTTDDVINWLDQHNEIGESPYIPEKYKKSKNGE